MVKKIMRKKKQCLVNKCNFCKYEKKKKYFGGTFKPQRCRIILLLFLYKFLFTSVEKLL